MKPLHQFKNIYNPYSLNVGNEQPSLHEEAAITDAVKPVDRDIADIEAEKDEIILKPDLSGIYKIKGKRHSQGGSPIKAEAGSFIFSDFKNLAISKKDQELMELKKGGPVGKQKNTPAEVVQRNVDIKHYNRLINHLSDINKDEITKRTSTLMLEKYKDTLGRVAYLQEEKKQFESGIPDFAQNTAPAIHPELEFNIDKQEQYKTGGMVNPYLETMQAGGRPNWLKMWTKSNTPAGRRSITGEDTVYNTTKGNEIYDNYDYWKTVNRNQDFQGPKEYQQFVYDQINSKKPLSINDMWDKFGSTNLGLSNPTDNDLGFADGFFGARTAGLTGLRLPENLPLLQPERHLPSLTLRTRQMPGPVPDTLNPDSPQGTYLPYQPNVQRTVPMLTDEMWAGVDAASVKKYNPYRQQVKSQLVDFERYNPQTAVNRTLQASNSAYNATRGMNPYQAAATINEVHGKSLESVAQIQGQYDERNVGQANQQNQSNVAIQNKDLGDNIAFDKKYYDEQTLSNQRFDNAKTYAWGQFRDTRNRNRESLDSLYNLLSQQPIAGSKQLIDRNGKPILGKDGKPMFQDMPLYDLIPGTIKTRYTGVGNILNAQGSISNGGAIQQEINDLRQQIRNELNPQMRYTLLKEYEILNKQLTASQKIRKKGGTINPYN